ncbi:MAG: PAS domain S-box protein, partial [Candidatus Bathyarchaeota archaeon]
MQSLKSKVERSTVETTRTREQPKEFRESFLALLNLMPDPVVIVDGKGKFLEVNDRVEEITGFNKQELIGKSFLRTRIVTARSKAILVKNLAKRMIGINIDPYEIEVLSKDGQRVLVEVNARKIEYYGKPADLVIFRDTTGRKKMEQLYRHVVELSPESILTVDTRGVITSCNTAATKMLGFSKDEMVGKHFSKIGVLRVKDLPKYMKLFSSVLNGKVTKPLELTFSRKDGTPFLAEVRVGLLKRGNKAIGLQAVSTDITERKKMEEKLKKYSEHLEERVQKRTEELLESEKGYSVLMEEMNDGVVIIQDGKVAFANKKCADITGYSREELVGCPFEKFLDEKIREQVRRIYIRRMQGENVPAPYELEVISKTGERISVEVSGKLIRYKGRPADFATVRDISERKKLEEQRLRLEKLAAIGEMATMVGHDLRNPLQSIANATYYLNNELPRLPSSVPIPHKVMEMLQLINDSVNYADKIIRDLRDFSATKQPMLESTDINAIVKETMTQLEAPENVGIVIELGHLPEIGVDR